MQKVCECGKVIDKKDIGKRIILQRDANGKIIFHVCMHNVVITDERQVTMENFLEGYLVCQEYKVVSVQNMDNTFIKKVLVLLQNEKKLSHKVESRKNRKKVHTVKNFNKADQETVNKYGCWLGNIWFKS